MESTLPFSPRTQRSSESLLLGLEERSNEIGVVSVGSKPRMKQSSVSSKRLMSSIFLRQAMALIGLSNSCGSDRTGVLRTLLRDNFLAVVMIPSSSSCSLIPSTGTNWVQCKSYILNSKYHFYPEKYDRWDTLSFFFFSFSINNQNFNFAG